VSVGVFIGSSVSPAQQPTSDETTTITAIDYNVIDIKRSWELNTTRYVLNPANTTEVLGQYIDPTNLPSLAPNNYKGSRDLIVDIEPCPSPIQLLFSGGFINTITASGAYHINVNAPPVGITYVWTANYYDVNNILISAVAGAGTTGTQSNFTIDLLTMPSNAEYVFYTCTSNEGANAIISIVLIQAAAPTPCPVSFDLVFSGGNPTNITANGTYSVAPVPLDPLVTYAYTADFYTGVTNLGAVPGFGVSGVISNFTIDLATIPAGATFIKYDCTATGTGLQNGETAIAIIGLIQPCPPQVACDSCCPSIPGNDDVELIRSTAGNIEYTQHNPTESLKLLTGDRLAELKITLTDSYGDTLHTDKPIYYECEVRSTNSGGGSITES
jgi:hypothetical protein